MAYRRFIMLLLALMSTFVLFGLAQAQPIPLPLAPTQGRAVVELLANTGFEGDSDGDKLPDGWDGSKTSDPSADKQKCNKEGKVFANTGNCAFMFKGNPDGSKSKLKQNIVDFSSIEHESELTLSAYVDQKSGVPNSKIASAKLKLSDDSKLKLELRLSGSPATGYALITDTEQVVLPTGVSITGVSVDLRYGEVAGKYLVDDVSLTVSAADIPFEPAQLLPSDGAAEDYFGAAVSLSVDGNTALIGALNDDTDANTNQGAAYVFVRSEGIWTQQAKLVASDGATTDSFGSSVSLSADGNIALIGANGDAVLGNDNQGSAYIFVRTGTTWTQQQQLLANDGAASDLFGDAVTLSADGNTALIGALGKTIGANSAQGSAYIFVRSGGIWIQQQQISASDGAENDVFGDAVSLSRDGKTALIGSPGDDTDTKTNHGSAYIFTLGGNVWTQQAKLLADDGDTGDYFGNSVSLSADGNIALMGAFLNAVDTNFYQGSAYVFTRSGSIWTQQQQLLASDGATNDSFGAAVDISDDGSMIAIGANGDDIVSNLAQGSTYIFLRSGSTWTQQQQLIVSDGAQVDNFGYSISLNADGRAILIGAYRDTVGDAFQQGSAWVVPIP